MLANRCTIHQFQVQEYTCFLKTCLDCGLELDAVTTKRGRHSPVDGFRVDPPQICITAVGKPQSLDVLHLADVVHHTVHGLQSRQFITASQLLSIRLYQRISFTIYDNRDTSPYARVGRCIVDVHVCKEAKSCSDTSINGLLVRAKG